MNGYFITHYLCAKQVMVSACACLLPDEQIENNFKTLLNIREMGPFLNTSDIGPAMLVIVFKCIDTVISRCFSCIFFF